MSGKPRLIYLDWNATTPPHAEVVEAMRRQAETDWGNPESVHTLGRRARAVIEELREAIADHAGSDPRDVLLVSGGTEANNLALAGVSALVTSRLEHPSVIRVAEALAERGVPVRFLPLDERGVVEPESVADALGELPVGATVAVMAVNHETGAIQPIAEIAELVRRAGGRLHVDAVQAVGKLAPTLYRVADSLALAAHKFRGPKGIGALVFRGSPSLLRPLLRGGAQQRGLRPGTQDPVAAAGFLTALRLSADGPSRYARLAAERDRLEEALAPWAQPNVSSARAPHVSNLWVPGLRGDELVAALDLQGVCVSSGSACSAGSSEASPVLSAMYDETRARESVRVSLGDATPSEAVEAAISVMRRVLSVRVRRA